MIILDDGFTYDWFCRLSFEDIGVTKLDLVTYSLASGIEDQLLMIGINEYNNCSKQEIEKLKDSKAIILCGKSNEEEPHHYLENIIGVLYETTHKDFIHNLVIHWESQAKMSEILKSQLLTLNGEMNQLMGDLGKEIQRVKKFYQLKTPKRFQDVRGISFSTKYFAGENMGGEYLDSFFKGNTALIFMSSVSSFLASSSIIDCFSRFKTKTDFSQDSLRDFLKECLDELSKVNKKFNAEILIGVFNLNDLHIQGYSLGDFSCISKNETKRLSSSPLFSETLEGGEFELHFKEGEKYLLTSPGFTKNWSKKNSHHLIEDFLQNRDMKPLDILDETFFQIKKDQSDGMLSYDATCLLMEVHENVIRKI